MNTDFPLAAIERPRILDKAARYLLQPPRTVTANRYERSQGGAHLRAWVLDPETRMNPSLLHGQAIRGRAAGRNIGVIDTIHLAEVARGAKRPAVSW